MREIISWGIMFLICLLCTVMILLIVLIYQKIIMIRTHTAIYKQNFSLSLAKNIIENSVLATNQTWTNPSKEYGLFDDKAREEAWQRTKSFIKNCIRDSTIMDIADVIKEPEEWEDIMIFSTLQKLKMPQK